MTSSSTVSHCALVHARPGFSAELGARLQALAQASGQAHGCLHFAVQRSQCDDNLWLVSGFWAGQEAMLAWFDSPAMQVFSDLVQELLVRQLDLHTFADVAAA
jgi:quinol monooxygenase YgiN